MRVRKAAALVAVLALMLALASCGETVGSYRVLDTLAEQQFSIGYRSGDNVQPYVEAAIRELAADGTIHSLALKWFAEDDTSFPSRAGALESVRGVLPELAERAEEGLRLFTRGQEMLPKEAREYGYRHEPAELLGALLAVFSRTDARLPGPPAMEGIAPRRIVYGVRDKSRELIALLEGGRRTLREIYALAGSRSELVASFLSVLELCAMGSIILTDREDGEIDVSFAGGDVDSIIEAIEE